jgi:hypothetical protein
MFLLFFFVYSHIALWYDSQIIGILAIAFLESFLGFYINVSKFVYTIGFKDTNVIASCTVSSACLVLFQIVMHLLGLQSSIYVRPFKAGILFIGTFVYLIGMLIISSKIYNYKNMTNYVTLNIFTVLSYLAIIFTGSIFGSLSVLQNMGGTFLVLYLLDKYIELPIWSSNVAGFSLLGYGGIMYGIGLFANMYPQYLLSITNFPLEL